MKYTAEEIQQLSESFEGSSPQEILAWAVAAFSPEIAVSTSFQTHSMALLHMVSQAAPDLRIFFLDTGFHFWETQIFRERIQMEWGLNVVDLYRDSRWDVFCRRFGRDLPVQDPNLCCYIHKVQPMQQALQGVQAWVTGIRRDQTSVRAQAHILELQPDGLLKVNPLLNWNRQDIQDYIDAHNLPAHPLLERGYRSVGCQPCTKPVNADEDDRAGRWVGKGKTECGLHTALFNKKDMLEIHDTFLIDPLKDNAEN
jgi:phosphoadenosine phosphosulfate reductase